MNAPRSMTRAEYATVRRGYRDARRADARRYADDLAYRDGPVQHNAYPVRFGGTYSDALPAELAVTLIRYYPSEAKVVLRPETQVALARQRSREGHRAHQKAVQDAIDKMIAWSHAMDAEMAARRQGVAA